jgi:PAS domain S-box-containing protein
MKTIDDMMRETVEPVVIANQFGFVTYVNQPFEVLFGWASKDIMGQPLAVIIPALYHDAHNLGFSRFTMTEMPTVLNHPLNLKAIAQNGQEILSEHYITAESCDGQWMFGAILRPLDHYTQS